MRFVIISGVFLGLGLCTLAGVFFLEDYEAYIAAVGYGFPAAPTDLWLTNGMFCLMPFIYCFSSFFEVNFYGVFSVIMASLSVLVVIRLLWKLDATSSSISWVLLAGTLPLILNNLFILSFTRYSVLLAAAGLVYSFTFKSKRVGFFLFALGTIARMHTSLIVFLLFAFFTIPQQGFKRFVRANFWSGVFLALVLFVYHAERLYTNNTGKIYESFYEYNFNNAVVKNPAFTIASLKDSMLYSAVERTFLLDTANINVAYLKKIAIPSRQLFIAFAASEWRKAAFDLWHNYLLFYWGALGCFALLCLYVVWISKNRKSVAIILLFTSISWLLLMLLMSLFFPMQHRFFSPMLLALFVGSFLLYDFSFKKMDFNKYLLFLPIALLLLNIPVFINVYHENRQLAQQADDAQNAEEALLKMISTQPDNFYLLLNSDAFVSPSPFAHLNPLIIQKTFVPDIGFTTHYGFAQMPFKTRLGFTQLDFKSFADFLKRNQAKTIFVDTKAGERLALYKQYFDVVWGFKFIITPVDSNLPPSLGAFTIVANDK